MKGFLINTAYDLFLPLTQYYVSDIFNTYHKEATKMHRGPLDLSVFNNSVF